MHVLYVLYVRCPHLPSSSLRGITEPHEPCARGWWTTFVYKGDRVRDPEQYPPRVCSETRTFMNCAPLPTHEPNRALCCLSRGIRRKRAPFSVVGGCVLCVIVCVQDVPSYVFVCVCRWLCCVIVKLCVCKSYVLCSAKGRTECSRCVLLLRHTTTRRDHTHG